MKVLSPEEDASHQRLLLATRYRRLALPSSSAKREVMLQRTSSSPGILRQIFTLAECAVLMPKNSSGKLSGTAKIIAFGPTSVK